MKNKISIKLILLLVLAMIGVMYSPKQEVLAAVDPVKICAVSYIDESILVITNGNSRLYYGTESDAARNVWDVIDVPAGQKIFAIDISSLSSNVENIMFIKGNLNETPSRVIIKKKPLKLEVSINYSQLDTLHADDKIAPILNIMSSEGTAANPIDFMDLEWKKGEDGRWLPVEYLTKKVLNSYLIRGTKLYFRVSPLDDIINTTDFSDIDNAVMDYAYRNIGLDVDVFGTDYPDGMDGRRASDGVLLKIGKQAVIPVTGVDGSKFTIDIKYGQEYRVTTVSGSAITGEWTKITDRTTKKLPLYALVGGTSNGLSAKFAFPEMIIETRNYSTSKAAYSKVTETHLQAQRILPGNIVPNAAPIVIPASDFNNIFISYNGTKNINVQIPSASDDNPYEYSVVRDGVNFDVSKASWTPITKGTIVKILSSKAVDQSTLYIRQKEIKYRAETDAKSAVAYQLASTIKTFKVDYPSMPTTAKKTYVFTKGTAYEADIVIDITLNTAGKLPFETELKYIKLGTKDIPIVGTPTITPSISGGIDPNIVYTMHVTLNKAALKEMTNSTARPLSIYYMNGTVDKTSAKLTIKNPTDALGLTTTTTVGTVDGTTAITLVSPPSVDNHLRYEISSAQITGKKMEDKFTAGSTFTSGMNIAITADQWITIYELNADDYIMKYKSIQIKATEIKQPATP